MGDYDEDLNDVVDFIQETLECCGVNNTDDWLATPYYEETDRLPSSCCDGEPNDCIPEEAYDKVSTCTIMYVVYGTDKKSATIKFTVVSISGSKASIQISLCIVPKTHNICCLFQHYKVKQLANTI